MERIYIGGQAVIEGVMMKCKDQFAIAVRKPDHTISVKVEDYVSLGDRSPLFRIPIIRGVVNFIESLIVGVNTLTYSASFFEEEEVVPKSQSEAVVKKGGEGVLMFFTVLFSILLAIGLFILIPAWLSEFIRRGIDNNIVVALLEGVIRLIIFLLYVFAISQMNDMKRVFMYHGAEHKTINCLEAGDPLTPENVMKHTRFHKRCGTSFLFVVMIVSILFFMVIYVENPVLRILLRLLLVPVIAGVSYEFIRLAGRNDSKLFQILSAPGLWVQRLTTKEPDEEMLEVAIASVEGVLDWKTYQQELKTEKDRVQTEKDAAKGYDKQVKAGQDNKDGQDDDYDELDSYETADSYDNPDEYGSAEDYDDIEDYDDLEGYEEGYTDEEKYDSEEYGYSEDYGDIEEE